MDKRSAVESLAFDGVPNEVVEPSRRNNNGFPSMQRGTSRLEPHRLPNKTLQANRPPNTRLMDNLYSYSNDSYPSNGEVCFNSARFAKVQDHFASDRDGNYYGESGDDAIDNEQYQFEQERISELDDRDNYYPPSTKEIKNAQNHVSFKTTRKSGSNQSRNEDYYRLVDSETKIVDNLKEADNLYAKLANDDLKDSGYYFIRRNEPNAEVEENPLNEPVCFGKSSYYQDFEDDQAEDRYSSNKTGNCTFAGPDDQFPSRRYPGARHTASPNAYNQQMNTQFSKSNNFQKNAKLDDKTKESIYREVLNTINETVTELKNAGLQDEGHFQESVANLDQIQRYRNYMQDKFGDIQLKGNPLNEGSMAGRTSPQRNIERKAISRLDKRNDYRRIINEPKLNTTSEPKISPYMYRRREENRSPMRQNASHEMMQRFQSPEDTANEAYRRYCYYNMNDQCDKNFPENIDDQ